MVLLQDMACLLRSISAPPLPLSPSLSLFLWSHIRNIIFTHAVDQNSSALMH